MQSAHVVDQNTNAERILSIQFILSKNTTIYTRSAVLHHCSACTSKIQSLLSAFVFARIAQDVDGTAYFANAGGWWQWNVPPAAGLLRGVW